MDNYKIIKLLDDEVKEDDNDEDEEDEYSQKHNKTLKDICDNIKFDIEDIKTEIAEHPDLIDENKRNEENFTLINHQPILSVDDEDNIKFEYINQDGVNLDLINGPPEDHELEDDDGSLYEFNLEDEDDDDDDDDDDVTISKNNRSSGKSKIRYKRQKSSSLEYSAIKKFKFERNPINRRKHQRRLLQILSDTIYEYTHRVGHQAIILVAAPENATPRFSVFGARPLRNIIENLKDIVMEELRFAIKDQTIESNVDQKEIVDQAVPNSSFELPPLEIDGIPIPVERMTQSQLRAFIPLMLKYSTGRGKPGWGRESTKPKWWPNELPWANVRMDVRTDDEKQKISWTEALRKIVKNCYKFHGRADLLPDIVACKANQKRPHEPENDVNLNTSLPETKKTITLLKMMNSTNSFIGLHNDLLAQIQTTALPRKKPLNIEQQTDVSMSTIKPEIIDDKDTIDLTDDTDDDYIPNSEPSVQQETLPMVVIPPPLQAAPQQNLFNMAQLQSNNIIFLAPFKGTNTNYITIPSSQIGTVNTTTMKQQNMVQLVRLAD